jgi:peptidoglycan/xylan/chitin deacetylase (PgdA/CDA1 family)
MKCISPPFLLRWFYPGDLIWRIDTGGEKLIYLTFDDGPVPGITPKILHILSEFNAKATFFHVGENVMRYPEIYEQVVEDGHSIGNHTYNHINGWKSNLDDYVENVKKCNLLVKSKLLRPPFGKIRYQQIKTLRTDYKIIMWSVMSYDFDKNVSGEECVKNVIKTAGPGSIVVFHDSIKAEKNVLYALPEVLEYFSLKGFQFRSIPSL